MVIEYYSDFIHSRHFSWKKYLFKVIRLSLSKWNIENNMKTRKDSIFSMVPFLYKRPWQVGLIQQTLNLYTCVMKHLYIGNAICENSTQVGLLKIRTFYYFVKEHRILCFFSLLNRKYLFFNSICSLINYNNSESSLEKLDKIKCGIL